MIWKKDLNTLVSGQNKLKRFEIIKKLAIYVTHIKDIDTGEIYELR